MNQSERTEDGDTTTTDGIDHPLDEETVVEYDHPDSRIGESEGVIREVYDGSPVEYRVLDQNLENVRVIEEDINRVRGHVDDLDADHEIRPDGGRDEDGMVILDE